MDDRTSPLKLIPARTAAAAAPGFVPPGDGVPAPDANQVPLAYVADLMQAGHAAAASAFLVAALPRREAIWWGCRCVRSIVADLSPEAEAALKAAEAWAAAPGDVNRRKAMPLAEAIGFGHPAGCVALAVFLSGGSLAPAPLKEVPPPEPAFAKALAGALKLAAARAAPGQIPQAHRQFVDLGLAVARGEDRWRSSL